MLIRFTLGNIFSFPEPTVIDFLADKSTLYDEQVVRPARRDDYSIRKTTLILGKNAVGKSLFTDAIALLQAVAIGRGTPLLFDFATSRIGKMSSATPPFPYLEAVIRVEGGYYAYGVRLNSFRVEEEWLDRVSPRKRNAVFHRYASTPDKNEFSTGVGAKPNDHLPFLMQTVMDGSSFLYEYMTRHGEALPEVAAVFDWFRNHLHIHTTSIPRCPFLYPSHQFFPVKDTNYMSKMTELLHRYYDNDLKLQWREKTQDLQFFPESASLKKVLKPESKFILYHVREGGIGLAMMKKGENYVRLYEPYIEVGTTVLPLSEDSTLREIFGFILIQLDLCQMPSTYILDGIGNGFHPLLFRQVFMDYNRYIAPKGNNQIVFLTSRDSALDAPNLRKDSIWLMDKDTQGRSSLRRIAPNYSREDIRKSYISGRYGAVPVFPEKENTLKNEYICL